MPGPSHPANPSDQAAAGAPGREGRQGKAFSRCKTPDFAGTWHHAKHQADQPGNVPALVWTEFPPVNLPTGGEPQPTGGKKSQQNQGLAISPRFPPVPPVQKARRRCARPQDPAAKPPSQGPPDRLPVRPIPPSHGAPAGGRSGGTPHPPALGPPGAFGTRVMWTASPR
jgi:hypothetical protein